VHLHVHSSSTNSLQIWWELMSYYKLHSLYTHVVRTTYATCLCVHLCSVWHILSKLGGNNSTGHNIYIQSHVLITIQYTRLFYIWMPTTSVHHVYIFNASMCAYDRILQTWWEHFLDHSITFIRRCYFIPAICIF
jgi:hypothetical protein